ncbi:MAG: LysR family transcriptional regulator, partial [Pseudomonadota bacterium]
LQLTYFTAIAQAGQFSAASERVGISQSALSLQITALEEDLGTALFRRLPRGVELTEAGRQLLPKAHQILRELETVRLDIRASNIEPEGLVRLGMVPTLHSSTARPLAASLKQRLPKLELEMLTGPSNYLADQLREGRLDLAILQAGRSGIAPLEAKPLMTQALYLMTAAERRPSADMLVRRAPPAITFEALTQFCLLSTDLEDGLGYLLSQYEAETGTKLQKTRSFGQLQVDLEAVMAGEAAMLLPHTAITHLDGQGRIAATAIIEPEVVRDLFLVSDPRREVTSAIKSTAAHIMENIAGLVPVL